MIGAPIGFSIGGVLEDTKRTASLDVILDDAMLLATATLLLFGTEGTLLDDCTIFAAATFRRDNITSPRQSTKLITTAVPSLDLITTARSSNQQITA